MKPQGDGIVDEALDAPKGEAVAQYLRTHPNFFDTYPDVLRDIEISHGAGDAVSLLERQVAALRNENTRMKLRFEQLVELATSNENLIKRIHQLALALMEAAGPEAIFATLGDRLAKEFDADRVCTVVFANPSFVESARVPEFVGKDWPGRPLFAEVFKASVPKCGSLTEAQAKSLFPRNPETRGSAASLPLSGKAWDGLLVISSEDETRFHADMGTEFLAYLGDIVSLILDPWVERGQSA